MPEAKLPDVIDAGAEVEPTDDQEHADALKVARIFAWLAVFHDYSATWIQLLARLGDDDARAHISEAQADMSKATAEGYRELREKILIAAGEIIDPGQNDGPPAVDATEPEESA